MKPELQVGGSIGDSSSWKKHLKHTIQHLCYNHDHDQHQHHDHPHTSHLLPINLPLSCGGPAMADPN